MSHWRITKMTMSEDRTVATLVRIEWFKKNPAYEEGMAEFNRAVAEKGEEAADEEFRDQDLPDEFIAAEPGDDDAEAIVHDDQAMTIALDDDQLTWRPGDEVEMDLRRVG